MMARTNKTGWTVAYKADTLLSFQPQNSQQNLIDILPFLEENGIHRLSLRNAMSLNRNGERSNSSRPFKIDNELGKSLYKFLSAAPIKLTGNYLASKHPKP